MNILSFDTSLNKTFVSLSKDEKILSSNVIENHGEKYHSAYLIPTIVSVLKEHKLVMQDIDAVAVNIGPGSFTGIRACVTVARVIAQQLNCPLVGVCSLEILSKINKNDTKTIIVLDARKNHFYTAVYENGVEIQKPALTPADEVLNIDYNNAFVITDSASADLLKQKSVECAVYTELDDNLGLYLNDLAFAKLTSSNNVDEDFAWGKLKPLYLQVPFVSTPKKAVL